MKKVITTFLAILLILCSLCTLTACEDFYYAIFTWETYDRYEEENWEIAYSERFNDAVVGMYYWSGDLNDMSIVIPDTYRGAPVTSLGGPVINTKGLVFGIENKNYVSVKDKYGNYISYSSNNSKQIDDEISLFLSRYGIETYTINEYVFNLSIGANLQTIDNDWVDATSTRRYSYTLADCAVVELYSFYVTVDSANEYYYSDDLGRVYSKESNQLVTAFIYHNRDDFPEGSLPAK